MKYLALLLAVVFLFSVPVTVSAEQTIISVDDENINYVGRWIKNDKGIMEGSYECYLSLRFTGTSITLNKGSYGAMYYRIDGGEYKEQKSRTLGKNLTEGEHLLEICSVSQHGFPKISGFILDEGATTLPFEKKPVIEFIGDSILEGYVVGNNSVLNSYGHMTAEKLGFYRNIVAFGGITVSQGYGSPDNQGMINRYKMIREYSANEPVSPQWDMTRFVPDYIVINLGTNDGNVPASQFRFWYFSLLSILRTNYKDAKIFVMTTFCGRQNENIKAAYENFKDENTYLIDSYLWNIPNGSDNLHPDVDGHKMITEKLSEEITRILNTTPEPEATPSPTEAPSQPKKTNWVLPVILTSAACFIIGTFFIIKKKKR